MVQYLGAVFARWGEEDDEGVLVKEVDHQDVLFSEVDLYHFLDQVGDVSEQVVVDRAAVLIFNFFQLFDVQSKAGEILFVDQDALDLFVLLEHRRGIEMLIEIEVFVDQRRDIVIVSFFHDRWAPEYYVNLTSIHRYAGKFPLINIGRSRGEGVEI